MTINLKTVLRFECLGIVLVFIIFSIFDFYPKLKRAGQLDEKIKLNKMAIKTVSQSEMQKYKRELEEELSLGKEELQFIQQAIPEIQAKLMKEKNIPLVTREIVEIAASSEIELTSVKPSTTQGKDGYQLIPMKMRLQCGYTDLIRFLSEMEDSSTLVAVQDLSINKDEAIYPELDIGLTACALYFQLEVMSGGEEN